MFQRLRDYFRPAPLASAGALRTFLEERAALIAQKCAIDYCRGKTGLASYALFTEKPFLDALEICRWETFAAALGDLCIVAEGHLRPHAGAGELPALRAALVGLHAQTLDRLPVPAHRAQGWRDAIESLGSRMPVAAAGEPPRARDVADHSAKKLFDTLPIHLSMRELDEEVVYGAVRFRMVAVSQEMERRLRGAELVRDLLAA